MKNGSETLKRRIRQDLKYLRRQYAMQLSSEHKPTIVEWLCDNYYILEREGQNVIRSLRALPKLPRKKGSGLPVVMDLCAELCKEGVVASQEAICREIKKEQELRGVGIGELESLPVLMRAQMIHLAAESYRRQGEQGVQKFSFAIKTLQELENIDYVEIFEQVSEIDQVLRQDPAGIYQKMDERTRAEYRTQIAKLADRDGSSELSMAKRILAKAAGAEGDGRHVGMYLYPEKKSRKGIWLILMQIGIPALLAVAAGILLRHWWLCFVLFFPLWEICKAPIESIFLSGEKATYLPRLDTENGELELPQTLVTVSALLPSAKNMKQMRRHLEQLYLSNRSKQCVICLLADLKVSKSLNMPSDREDIAQAKRMTEKLNKKYGDQFVLIIRKRTYSKTQKAYAGYERKRGAIEELVRYIKHENNRFLALHGAYERLKDTAYILALDSDTELTLGTVGELVGTAIHPLNRAVLNEEKTAVERGYGILAPRVEVDLASANATPFSRLMSGGGGITAYDNSASDQYQDLFGEGIFAGKGLIDVEAFYTCLDHAFPEERVLSHDILEGSYLRTAFVSDIQLTDGFPRRQGGYLDRLHRWVRGDWQNIPWLGRHIKLDAETKVNNPINTLSKYKLFDNLRRSFTPVNNLLLLFLAAFFPAPVSYVLVFCGIFSATGGAMFSSLRALIAGGPSMFSRRYYSKAMPVALSALSRGAIQVIMMPQTAFVCADAIIRALWRRFVSRMNLLQWVTAAQSDTSQGVPAKFVRYLPSIAIGILLAVVSTDFVRLFGLAFVANFPLSFLMDSEQEQADQKLGERTEEKLTSYAAAIWRYYEEFVSHEDHYLPPDNVQETPVHRVAHRTSPTNIGLMMLCYLSARDFGFIDSAMLYWRIERTLSSVESLEKWQGNLLNWYDTKTLQPLEPRYVSTVDSGNFVCCLVALREGITEYIGEYPDLEKLVARLTKVIEETDLTPLYSKRRKQFHIGYDLQKEELSGSFYDLLMSEARMTGYYAIASGQVSKKHWGALGRTLARENGYTGPVSWTGTMFEYYMPHLLLPVYANSLGSEALRFCTHCQKNRTRAGKYPWGISESGFYAFDRDLNYQYKAHGVQKLGLRRGMNSDLVVSPYSTFLVLPFERGTAMRNLSKLEEMQITGRCGFYEAVDFTRSRTGDTAYKVIRSYMAHHLGMSLLSISNTVFAGTMQKRFMRNTQMLAAKSLLQEKIPNGAIVFRDVDQRDVPERITRGNPESKEIDNISPLYPHVKLLTNGEWTSVLSDTGAGVSIYRGMNINRRSEDLLRRSQGIYAAAHMEGQVIPFTRAPDYGVNAQYKAEFGHTSVEYGVRKGVFEGKTTVVVHPNLACEQRQFQLKNHSKHAIKTDFLLYFEPCLSTFSEDSAHQAFSQFLLEAEYDESNQVLVYTRRQRGKEQVLCLAIGFLNHPEFAFELGREHVLKTPLGMESFGEASKEPLQNKGGVPDVCAALRVTLEIGARSHQNVDFAMCAASSKEEAIEQFLRVREQGALSPKRGAASPFHGEELDGIIASAVLPNLLFQPQDEKGRIQAAQDNLCPMQDLWKLGISGDNPIVAIEIHNAMDVSRALPYIRLNNVLRRSSIFTDVVLLYREGGDYSKPILSEVRKILTKEGCRQSLGENGGIHAVDLVLHGEWAKDLVLAAASYIAPPAIERMQKPYLAYKPMKISPVQPCGQSRELTLETYGGNFGNGTYLVNGKPEFPWCHILANPTFGTMASQNALGCTWAVNARENKLTGWYNDFASDNRGEMLMLRCEGVVYDIIWGSQAEYSPDAIRYYGSAEGLDADICITVPEKGMYKTVSVSLKNTEETDKELELCYYTEPVLGVNRGSARHLKSEQRTHGLVLSSDWSTAVRGSMFLYCTDPIDFFTCNRADALGGVWDSEAGLPLEHVCALIGVKRTVKAKFTETVEFKLGFARDAAGIDALVAAKPDEEPEIKLTVHTPSEPVNQMVNTWLPHQILSSRIYSRTGFYQCGGAFGFRDQLQDSLSMLLLKPKLVRQHILRSAARQFPEGDVLHWWHNLPGSGGGLRGVRTRYSDDLLWLPFVTAEYVLATGDESILDIRVPFVEGELLKDGEAERYFEPKISIQKDTLYEHCMLAIKRALQFGPHGLPLMGGGDWNDGYNQVGLGGKGESVWLAQFLIVVLNRFAKLCDLRGEHEMHAKLVSGAQKLKKQIDETAWNGKWYLRAFFDDGTPMGGRECDACKLDLLPQAWAVFSEMPDHDRVKSALKSVLCRLVDFEHGVIRLFDPPFGKEERSPGYVSTYPKGIRENGGQYTHAAVWLALSFYQYGRHEEGYKLLRLINPIEKYLNPRLAELYKKEPYALAGDVYAHPDCRGQGGWSLYTGAASWYYKALTENMLGLCLRGGRLFISPALPEDWDGYTASLQIGGAELSIEVRRGTEPKMLVDGEVHHGIRLDGKNHRVLVEILRENMVE